MRKRRTDKQVDEELIAKGRQAEDDFDISQESLFIPPKRSSKLISIRIPTGMIKRLKNVARKRGEIGYQRVIKEYIHRGLRSEIEIISSFSNRDFLIESLQTSSDSASDEMDNKQWRSKSDRG